MTSGDWEETTWTVYANGTCTAKSRFADRPDCITHKTVLSADTLKQLGVLLTAEREPFTYACDGSAWAFRIYDSDGKAADEIGPGYIYDCPTLESIVSLLPSQDALIQLMVGQFHEEDRLVRNSRE